MGLPEPATAGSSHADAAAQDGRGLGADFGRGLTQLEASRRLASFGPNELPAPHRPGLPARLGRHLTEPMTLLLSAAAGVAGFALSEQTDALVIVAIVVANTAIALVQEGRAARALEALRTLQVPTVTVFRDGKAVVIESHSVVPGDVVELGAGDRIPADLHWIETSSVEIDESLLTGESLPVSKDAGPVADPAAPIDEQASMGFAGTLVVRGAGRGGVVATGRDTKLGLIAATLEQPEPATPLQRQLRHLTAQLGGIAVAVAVAVFVLTAFRAGVSIAFLSGVALAVAAVPEGLPTVVTVALALGVRRMATRGAIVRRLLAVETLGSAGVILTDKTGTLTQNRMQAEQVALPGAPWRPAAALVAGDFEEVAAAMVLCNDAGLDPPTGDPMEIALLTAVGAKRTAALRQDHPRIASRPFDAERKRMITVNVGFAGGPVAFVKGAPEVVLPRCMGVAGSPAPLDSAARTVELERAAAAAAEGARVLALARGRRSPTTADAAEADLLLVGLVALRDPVRPEAADAVREAGAAGVRVVMVTGDHPGTASAVAAMVGLAAGPPVTGVDLRRDGIPSDPLSHRVYARVDPREKLALVEALQADGHVVAVTGDGVNDAPALRRADIGAAMGRSGSDVAREAADLVVTDDDLATIVAAIREGRGIYDNIRKVVDYLVAGNLSEIMVVVAGLLAFPALGVPLLPLQLLWINLLTDGLPAVAFGVDPPDPGLMRRPPRPRSRRLLDAGALRMLGGRAALVAGAAVGSLAVARFAFGEPWEHARAVMFSVLVGAHLLYAFAARWPRGGRSRQRPGVWLVAAVTAGLSLQVAVVMLEPLHRVFGTAPLTLREWALVAVGATAPLAIMALAARGRPADRLRAVRP